MSDEAKNTQLSEKELEDRVASSDTGARQPSNAIAAKVMIYVALAWSLFQLWYASPLPFMLNFFIVNDAEARAIHLGFSVFLGFMAKGFLILGIGDGTLGLVQLFLLIRTFRSARKD